MLWHISLKKTFVRCKVISACANARAFSSQETDGDVTSWLTVGTQCESGAGVHLPIKSSSQQEGGASSRQLRSFIEDGLRRLSRDLVALRTSIDKLRLLSHHMLDGLNDYKNWTKMLPILPDNKLPNNDRKIQQSAEKLEVARRLTMLAAYLISPTHTEAQHGEEQAFVDSMRQTLERQCLTQVTVMRVAAARGLNTSPITSLIHHVVLFLQAKANSGWERIKRRDFAVFLLTHASELRSEAQSQLNSLYFHN